MSEEVLGIIQVLKTGFRSANQILFVTPDRVIVARKSGASGGLFGVIGIAIQASKGKKREKEYLELSPEDVLKADKKNFALPNSEIREVELKCGGGNLVELKIITSEKKHKWLVLPFEVKKEQRTEDCENILRPVFGDRLSVKK